MTARRSLRLGLVVALAACTREPAPEGGAPVARGLPAATATVVDTAGLLQRCEPIEASLRRLPGLIVSQPGTTTLASAWAGAEARSACRLAANGHFVGRYASMDSLFRWLRAAGWGANTTYSADGPDGTVAGMHRSGVTCILEGHWDGGDDSDSTYVPSDTLDIVGTCAATLPVDTTFPPE